MNTVLKTNRSGTKQVLFLDSQNNYRSRFAEEYFNSYAIRYGLKLIASSRGVSRQLEGEERSITNYTLDELKKRGLYPLQGHRNAKLLKQAELANYDYIIAMDAEEMQPQMQKYYPGLSSDIIYWNVKNSKEANPSKELEKLTQLLDNMLV